MGSFISSNQGVKTESRSMLWSKSMSCDETPQSLVERVRLLEDTNQQLQNQVAILLKWKAEMEVGNPCKLGATTGNETILAKPDSSTPTPIIQISSIDEVKLGDVVERRANDTLNLTDSFLKTSLTKLDGGSTLTGWYWWPCEVTKINVDTGAYYLHYFGYDSGWDHWVEKSQRSEMLRPTQALPAELGEVKAGELVEVQIYQNTHISDKNAHNAYFWISGKVEAVHGDHATVKLDAVGMQKIRISTTTLRKI